MGTVHVVRGSPAVILTVSSVGAAVCVVHLDKFSPENLHLNPQAQHHSAFLSMCNKNQHPLRATTCVRPRCPHLYHCPAGTAQRFFKVAPFRWLWGEARPGQPGQFLRGSSGNTKTCSSSSDLVGLSPSGGDRPRSQRASGHMQKRSGLAALVLVQGTLWTLAGAEAALLTTHRECSPALASPEVLSQESCLTYMKCLSRPAVG